MADDNNQSSTSIDDDLDLLTGDAETEDKPEEKPDSITEEKDEEPEEVSGGEDETEEETETEEAESEEEAEDIENKDLSPHERPSIKDIKGKYPKLFKDFPSLRDMYFREQEYSNVFPTIADAKEASDYAEAFISLQTEVLSGNASKLFDAVEGQDKAALEKLSENILPSLYKKSPELHYKAVLPTLENLVRGMYIEGKNRGDANIENSAYHLSIFLFNDPKIATGDKTLIKPKDPEIEKERAKISEERESVNNEQHASFFKDVSRDANSSLGELILERGAGNRLKIDPENNFTPFIRNTIAERIALEVRTQMEADKTHMAFMTNLWKRAKAGGYQGDFKSRIVSAYLARAKSLIPATRSRIVSEAIGKTSEASKTQSEKIKEVASRKEPKASSKVSSNGNKSYTAKEVDWSRTTDEDFLNDRVKLKK